MNKLKVVVRAPSLTMSGYGVHSRQICKWALSRDDFDLRFDLLNWGINSWYINPTARSGLIGQIMKNSENKWGDEVKPDISFQVQLPNEWDPQLAHINIGITAAVETDICNPSWISNCNQMHAVIGPSHHTKDVLQRSGELRTEVYVIHESYIESICSTENNIEHKELVDSKFEKIDTKFNFLMMGQITSNTAHTDRKNTFNTLKLFCDTFADNKDVGLVIKTNSGHMTKIDRMVTTSLLQNALIQIRGKKKYPKVYLSHGQMNDLEVAEVYKHEKIHVLLSLTRGEGFGLPLLEAAASDLPIIVTNWSGHLDFMKLGRFGAVGYRMEKISSDRVDNQIFMENASWAEANYGEAQQKIRKIVSSYDTPKEWAVDLGKKVREQYSQEKISKLYTTFLSGIFGI